MVPSSIRNTMTRPLRMRPTQRAGFETGMVAVIVVMVVSRCLEWLLGFKTNDGGGFRQGWAKLFPRLLPFSPCGRRCRSAAKADEGSLSAETDPSSGSLPLRASDPPAPTRGLLRNPRFVILLGKALESNDGGKADRPAEVYSVL